jgi:lambda repressor-like predicted transcriptional regulator
MKPHFKLLLDGSLVPSMHPENLKAAIRMKGTTPAALAEELGVSRSTVTQVIAGTGVSARVQARIAQVIGIPVSAIWPAKKSLRRTRAAA